MRLGRAPTRWILLGIAAVSLVVAVVVMVRTAWDGIALWSFGLVAVVLILGQLWNARRWLPEEHDGKTAQQFLEGDEEWPSR